MTKIAQNDLFLEALQMPKMASRIKTFSRLQLSLKLVHTKRSVTQLHNLKEYTNTFEVQ
ncbi:uncharacterized protein LACBIDRAFT_310351 [Laccaria bicolor S238N-H82]|uniref:Predicted protein n=1 Tax=Laccaria bicolor (strain S238N-H82 / ATCC MYA-4686) TaxID=486041 RepID=B0DU57_LACBS|nr:uncharacterized protein LACBIDRAFT_310351 [Laccaria bicolor S238N-H82]EDR01889.1 predicted protein [Laccaria bicolor S238N-H82]|eukprot:XP_001887499.1 predicted protein [Laccaria bicolor S238N-H82]